MRGAAEFFLRAKQCNSVTTDVNTQINECYAALGKGLELVPEGGSPDRATRVGDIPNERENREEFLGRNRRPEQTQTLKHLKLGLSHVVTCQERGVLGESLPRQRQPLRWLRFCPGEENSRFGMGKKQKILPIEAKRVGNACD